MKSILVVLPFESIFPPMNGGMLRGFNLLNQLSKYFKVTAIINQEKNEFLRCKEEYPSINNCTIISTVGISGHVDIFSILPEKIRKSVRYRFWNRSLKGPAEGNFLLMYPILKSLLKKQSFDFVLLEDMGILNIAKLVRRFQPAAKIIYDAYNVNTRLAKVSLANNYISKADFDLIEKQETTLSEYVDVVFTCSETDLQQLIEMNGAAIAGKVIPNGVNIPDNGGDRNGALSEHILFCGSLDYFPNIEGLTWFCKEVFPLLLQIRPQVKLMVVGKGNPGEELKNLLKNDHIINYGMVDNVGDYYKKAKLALVPLLSGSGTRLKLLEAMGYGVAVVSTTIGAEGIEYSDGENIMIADGSETFAQIIARLLERPDLLERVAKEGRYFVKQHYDWNIVGEKLLGYLNNEI